MYHCLRLWCFFASLPVQNKISFPSGLWFATYGSHFHKILHWGVVVGCLEHPGTYPTWYTTQLLLLLLCACELLSSVNAPPDFMQQLPRLPWSTWWCMCVRLPLFQGVGVSLATIQAGEGGGGPGTRWRRAEAAVSQPDPPLGVGKQPYMVWPL